jgi:hypothetical protein
MSKAFTAVAVIGALSFWPAAFTLARFWRDMPAAAKFGSVLVLAFVVLVALCALGAESAGDDEAPGI